MKGTSVGHLVQPPCSSKITYSWLPRTMSRLLLSSSKDEDPSTSLGNPCLYSVTLTVKKCFLTFRWNLLFESIACCLVTGHYWQVAGSICFTPPFFQVLLHVDEIPPGLLIFQAKESCFSQLFLLGKMILSFKQVVLLYIVHVCAYIFMVKKSSERY